MILLIVAISSVAVVAVVVLLSALAIYWWKRSRTTRTDLEETQLSSGKSQNQHQTYAQYEEIDESMLNSPPLRESLKASDVKDKETVIIDVPLEAQVHPSTSGSQESNGSNDSTGYDHLTFERKCLVEEEHESNVYHHSQNTDEEERLKAQAAAIDVTPQTDIATSTTGNKGNFENKKEEQERPVYYKLNVTNEADDK